MRNPLLVVALAAVFATAAAAVEVGQAAPNFKFDKSWNALEGASQLDDYRGKLVLLEVWATW